MNRMILPSAKLPALWIFSKIVVMPNPSNPRGAGFAGLSFITVRF